MMGRTIAGETFPKRLSSLLMFLLLISIIADSYESASTNVIASCKDARTISTTQSYCDMVTWNAAHVYPAANYTDYSPGVPFSEKQQNDYARSIYQASLLANGNSVNSECGQALQRLACVIAFPSCRLSGTSISSIAYDPPCRLQCEQANARCPVKLPCDLYPITNCLITLPSGFFVYDPTSGPYEPLPIIYGISLGIWIIFAFTWNYLTFVHYKGACVIFCRVVSGVPIIKVVVLSFAMVFWSTGVSWRMFSFWMSVAVTNTQLVYETGQMLVFLLIAKGWTITRDHFRANEWRGVIIALSAFYMSNSIIIVLQATVLSLGAFWIANVMLYGSMFAYIYTCVSHQLKRLQKQVALLNNDMPANIVNPLRMKYVMYCVFLVLVLVSGAMEICSHAVSFADGIVWHYLLGYEISNVIILGTMGIVFRPQEYSPFFFMVPARLNDTRTRPIPILEAADDGDEDPEVDLAPLLQQPDLVMFAPAKMIVVRNPDKAISVGVSATAASMAGMAESAPRQGDEQRRQIGAMDIERQRDFDRARGNPDMLEDRIIEAGRGFLYYLGVPPRGRQGRGRGHRGGGGRGPGDGEDGGRAHHEVGIRGQGLPNAPGDPDEHQQFIVDERRRARWWRL